MIVATWLASSIIRPGIDYAAFGRYLDIVQTAVDNRIPLALSPAEIMHLEDAGAVVDLETGETMWLNDSENRQEPVEATNRA